MRRPDIASRVAFDASNPVAFGELVRTRRRAHKLSQLDLADAIGVHRRVIGELERGKTTIQLGIALKAAEGVGLDVGLLVRGHTDEGLRWPVDGPSQQVEVGLVAPPDSEPDSGLPRLESDSESGR